MLHHTRATVDYLDPNGTPVPRPYMNGAPSLEMVANFDTYNGTFEVDLWQPGRGFLLDLHHEFDYELDELGREALVPGIVRYEGDDFLEDFVRLLGPLGHFVRQDNT